ncbi:NAD(P)-binding protein [Mycena floridula]|nr:NAD(P)-binding protein [Mycena floridula]
MAAKHSSFCENSYPPKPDWTLEDVPDLTGKVCIVTGGNSGLGKQTVSALLKQNATVYIAGRNEESVRQAIEELHGLTGRKAHYLHLDLGHLKAVKEAAEEFLRKERSLHILFNNAGVAGPPIEQTTSDGYDAQFGTNGHFYFTQLLLPSLLSTAKGSLEKTVRVVSTSSWGHVLYPKLDFDSFKDTPARRKLAWRLYPQSKFATLANILFSNELARRYSDQGIVSTAVHPGNIRTGLQRDMPSVVRWILNKTILQPAELGVLTQLRAGTSPEGAEWNGKYIIPWARLGEPHKNCGDVELAKKLWDYMEAEVAQI